MNIFDILPDDVLWKFLTLTPSNSIKDYVVWLNHYLVPFSLTSKSNYAKLTAYLESEAFKTALHPNILNLGGPGNNFLTWNKRIKQHIGIASDWLYKPLEITNKKEIPTGHDQLAGLHPETQQWELFGINLQKDSIYQFLEDGQETCIALNPTLQDHWEHEEWRPCHYIVHSKDYVAVANGSLSIIVYDRKKMKHYPLPLQEFNTQFKIKNSTLYVRTLSQDEKTQSLSIYELDKLESGSLESQVYLLPKCEGQFFLYKDILVLQTCQGKFLQSLPLVNLKNIGIQNEWISIPLEKEGSYKGICVSEMGIFVANIEGDKLKIQCIQIESQGYHSQEKTIPLDNEVFHGAPIYDMIYHMDRLFIRIRGYKILVVDYFSERIIQTFDFVTNYIIKNENFYYHHMLAIASKVHIFFLQRELSDGSFNYTTLIHTLAPKKNDETSG